MRATGAGHALFAATLIAIGLGGLFDGAFGAIWQPVPKSWPAREALAYACALVSLGCGVGLLWRRTAAAAAGLLTAYLLVWLIVLKGRAVIAAPLAAVSWESAGETAVLLAAAWLLFARLASRPRGLVGQTGLRFARSLYGLSLVAFGAAHFAYVGATAALVPAWLPDHPAWVYLTGFAYIAAGAAIVAGVAARLAAALAALQIGLFTLLVWAPVVASGRAGVADWSEAIVSWALTTAAWVVFESYPGGPWPFVRFSVRSRSHRRA